MADKRVNLCNVCGERPARNKRAPGPCVKCNDHQRYLDGGNRAVRQMSDGRFYKPKWVRVVKEILDGDHAPFLRAEVLAQIEERKRSA